MSLPPRGVPFADLTPEDVARADVVFAIDRHDDEFCLELPVGRPDRAADDTVRLLVVTVDHSWRDLQAQFLHTMVMAATRAAAGGRRPADPIDC